MSKEIFANRIKTLREENNLNTREMAAIIGVTNPAISYYENCKREPTLSIIEAYANYFNVSTDYLFGRINDRLL